MSRLRYTLVADGSTDSCLVPVINWVLRNCPEPFFHEFVPQVADRRWHLGESKGLLGRIESGLRQFPCDLLFVHRDAERQDPELRYQEIEDKTVDAEGLPAYVPVVPVRMTEAWLLFDERAIRKAADNPNGVSDLAVPAIKRLENVPDPKARLRDCLLRASELKGRRRDQFKRRITKRMYRVSALVQDYTPLRQLKAFQRFEEDAYRVLRRMNLGGK